MSTEDKQNLSATQENSWKMPDLTEFWKGIYFQSEDTWARAVKSFVGNPNFAAFINEISSQYLSFHKISDENMQRYFSNSYLPSKKDLARVAELVVSVEDKVDSLDAQIFSNINQLTANLIKFTTIYSTLQDDLQTVRRDVEDIRDKFALIELGEHDSSGRIKE